MTNEKIQELEGQLKGCAENADVLEQELAHCPSALAFKARVGHALDMLGSLKREAATLPKPSSTVAALLLVSLISAFQLFSVSAFSQIIVGAVNITNSSLSCPVQQSFTPVTATETINLQSHAAQVLNVTTNETIILSYGHQPQGASGTNLTQFATITTNFTAAWVFATYGYATNNFAWTYVFPPVSAAPVDAMWGTFSNSLGSNTVTFF